MSDSQTFMMGKFEAEIPSDRLYAKNHMWALQQDDGFRFGLSAYAVRLLQDVYFLDWEVEAGAELSHQQEIGQIESSKAESSLYSPAAGRLLEINQQLLHDPSDINVDKYGAGWLFSLACQSDVLLSPEQYLEHLDAVWPVTQRTIKGQLNE